MADNILITGTIRPTPQNATLGAIAAALRKAQQFAGRYEVDKRIPLLGGTSVDELLSLPGAASLIEDVSYHGPRALIKGGNAATGGIGTFRLDPRVTDVADVALTVAPLAALAGKGVARAARSAPAQAIDRMVREGYERGVIPAPGMTIKPKGGNWRPEAAELGTDQFRQTPNWLSGEAINEAAGENLWAKMVQEGGHRDPHGWLRANRPDIYDKMVGPEGTAINRWLDTKLNKYIRNEMGTSDDPVKALAERGVLHFEPQGIRDQSPIMDKLRQRRQLEGYPMEGTATTPLGQQWERYSDYAIQPRTAGEIVDDAASSKYGGQKERAEMFLEQAPWIRKLDPEARVYDTDWRAFDNEALGFPHLIDELKFSMSPDSGLPANLRLDPKDIDKITVPQAVERVSKINAWRAEEAAKAERAGMMENLQATPRLADESLQLSFVEKPGGAWVDIPETVDDKGMKLCSSIGKAGGWCTQHDWAARSYGSGENRLTALVDTEGRPHAQAKITQDVDQMAAIEDATMYMTPEQELAYDRHFQKLDRPPELEESLAWLEENAPDAYAVYREVLNSQPKFPPNITELKPVGNSFSSERAQEYAKRDPDYFRKVENSVLKFLNNGNWGKVADLHHYGIVDLKEPNSLLDGLKTLYGDESSRRVGQEFIDAFNYAVDRNPNAPRFMTARQLREFIGPVEGLEGYAGGGLFKRVAGNLGEMASKYAVKQAPKQAPNIVEETIETLPKKEAAKNLRKFVRPSAVKQRVYHGGTYTPGDEVKKPLFVSPNKDLASAYVYDDYGDVVGKLSEMSHSATNPANEEKLLEVANKLGIEVDEANVPLSLFDKNLYGQKNVNKMLRELKRQGYDSAEGTDIGAGTSITDKSLVLFPGTQTAPIDGFGGGGVVKGAVKNIGDLVRKYITKEAPEATVEEAIKAAPKEQKMLQGFYRGYAGDYDASKAAEDAGMVFVTPQRAVGEFYANKRARQMGLDPHLEMILADPFAGRGYGHAIPTGPMNRKVDFTKARQLQPDDVKDRTKLYAAGGAVNYDPDEIAQIAERATRGFAAGGLVNYDPNEIDTIVSRVKEEFHA